MVGLVCVPNELHLADLTLFRCDCLLPIVDGREGFDGLERRVESKVAVVAFAIGRVSVQRIMKIADANQLLPPKASDRIASTE